MPSHITCFLAVVVTAGVSSLGGHSAASAQSTAATHADASDGATTQTVAAPTLKAAKPQSPSVPRGPTARGRVFLDIDGDAKFGDTDQPFVGVKVSNGKEIVTTNDQGKYELPLSNNGILFVIKPTGFRTAMCDDQLPKFYYIHKPDGSPALRYPGSKPTGPLPQSIDFPLYRVTEPETFRIVLFGDPQPRNVTEVDYIAQDVVSELIGCSHAFGVSLGDLAFDNLETLQPLNQTIGLIGIPWYNLIGNHDLNLDGKDRDQINETFESIYGPTYYSFDYGNVHFVALDNIDWKTPAGQKPHYHARFGKRQLEFLKNDLAAIPESQTVMLLMHCPLIDTEDRHALYRLIEKRPLCVSVAAHTHQHAHYFLGKEDGFNGDKKHHHIVNVTVSGAWWSGAKDERGIPHSTMRDGAPNGYSVMTFQPDGYQLDFKGAGLPADYQLRIEVPNHVSASAPKPLDVWVNVFNGSTRSKVELAVDQSTEWMTLEQKRVNDPYYESIVKRESKQGSNIKQKLISARESDHLWYGQLTEALSPGVHLLRARTTDMHGRTFYGQRTIRVTK